MRAETENEWREIDRRLALQTARIPRPCLLNIPIAACINVYSQILRAGVVESAETDRLSSGGKLSVKRDSSSRFDGFPNSSRFVHHNFDRPALLPTPSIVNFPQRGKQKKFGIFRIFLSIKKKKWLFDRCFHFASFAIWWLVKAKEDGSRSCHAIMIPFSLTQIHPPRKFRASSSSIYQFSIIFLNTQYSFSKFNPARRNRGENEIR